MRKAEIARRYALFVVGLFFSALGVAVTRHGELGVSPISSVANVMSCKFDSISLGTWLIFWNCVLIVGQIAILRRKFQWIQLLQAPLSILFGWFTDLGGQMVAGIPADVYPVRLLLVLFGTFILGFGIALAVAANVILNSGEAFVKAISDTTRLEFGNVKIAFDIFCVVLAVGLSLLLFDGAVVGTREGTVIAALLTGLAVKLCSRKLNAPLQRLLAGRKAE